MKQKTQGRELSTLVPASFFFSDYDEYAVISYSFTRVVFYLPFFVCSSAVCPQRKVG